jgi:hypothetical protein
MLLQYFDDFESIRMSTFSINKSKLLREIHSFIHSFIHGRV